MTRSDGLERLSLNQATTPGWNVPAAADGCARAGMRWIGLWRDRVAETGLKQSVRAIRDAGLGVSSLCRGGWFCAPDEAGRRTRTKDNRRAVDEAAALGARALVLVCGPAADRDLAAARSRVRDAIGELSEYAAESGVALAIEPLHPMYCGDRSVVVTMAQALALAGPQPVERVGLIVDAYHVWWDPDVFAQIAAARGRILGFHVSDWVVPPSDWLNGRGLMGDGAIELRELRRAVDAAGYSGPVEVEIFNPQIWALPGDEALALITRRYQEHVAG